MPQSVQQAGQGFGKVYLVGAGPGAADLLTVRAVRLLSEADVVLHDALVTDDILALCPQARKISVGKRSGQRSVAQIVINEQIVECARQYRLVVRLKGGDPMLFGRADEELRALEAHGIDVDVVPGITAAFAAAAATRQPLTRRGVARSISFFTSSTAPGEPDQARIPETDTLIQYMGGREAVLTAERLMREGWDADVPVIAVEDCSRPSERIHRMTLEQLREGLPPASGPVLIMIGWALEQRLSPPPE